MAKSNISAAQSKGPRQNENRPAKPYPDFPLFPHATKRWAKKIRGKLHYFGQWDDPYAALDEYLAIKDDLHAGRTPQRDQNALTIRELCNGFLRSKRIDLDAGRLSPRTFVDYTRVCQRLVNEIGATRAVQSLGPHDFEKLYAHLLSKYNVNTVSSEITMTRSVFKYALESDLIDKAVKFGPKFKTPSKQEKRKAKAKSRQQNGLKMFQPEEIRQLLDKASLQLKAMILLGINGGLGNTDCASLPMSALDLDGGWLDFPRPKTGIERRIPLWPETVAALREVIANRKEPADPADAEITFVTKYRQRWVRYEIVEEKHFGKVTVKPKQDDAISKETTKLLNELGIKRKGVGFYALRHTFETVAGGSRDQVAVDAIMGHVDNTMAGEYREHIDDERFVAVTNRVRQWLFGDREAASQDPEPQDT